MAAGKQENWTKVELYLSKYSGTAVPIYTGGMTAAFRCEKYEEGALLYDKCRRCCAQCCELTVFVVAVFVFVVVAVVAFVVVVVVRGSTSFASPEIEILDLAGQNLCYACCL